MIHVEKALATAALLASLCVVAGGVAGAQDDGKTAFERLTPRSTVAILGTLGAERLDIDAFQADLEAVLRQISVEAHRDLVGMQFLSRQPVVDAKLRNAELRDALKWIGGSVGLRITLTASEIRVAEDLTPSPTREELFRRSSTTYFSALRDYPGSQFAPIAAWNRARVESEIPGRELEAARLFDNVVESYPESDLIPEALLRAGQMFGKANAWDEAAARFDGLAGLGTKHAYSSTSRRLLADAHTRVADAAENPIVREENARRALLVLASLEDVEPTLEPSERRSRYMVRSRAHSLAGEPVEALRCLDLAERYSERAERDPQVTELRAMALERAERYPEAVKAWLLYGNLVEGQQRARAYKRAAIAANTGGENVAAITIARAAVNEGFGDEVAPQADIARTALDLDPIHLNLFGDGERVDRGVRLVSKRMFEEAAEALRPAFERRTTLQREQRKRLGVGYARALSELGQLEDAVSVLRTTAAELDRVVDRRDIYLAAASLLEDEGLLERAILALEGQL